VNAQEASNEWEIQTDVETNVFCKRLLNCRQVGFRHKDSILSNTFVSGWQFYKFPLAIVRSKQ